MKVLTKLNNIQTNNSFKVKTQTKSTSLKNGCSKNIHSPITLFISSSSSSNNNANPTQRIRFNKETK